MTNCSDGTFCPRSNADVNNTCCDKYQGQFAKLGHAVIPQSALSSIRATETSTSSSGIPSDSFTLSSPVTRPLASPTAAQAFPSTSTSTSASTSPSVSTTALDQSAKIGIGIGVSFGTLFFALLSVIAFRLSRNFFKPRRAEQAAPEAKQVVKNIECGGVRHELNGAMHPRELFTLYNTLEVDAASGPHEIPDSGVAK